MLQKCIHSLYFSKGLVIIWNLWYFLVIIPPRRFCNKDNYSLGGKVDPVSKKLMLRCKRQHGLYWNPAHYYKIQSKCVVNMLQQFTYIFILCLLPIHHCLMSCVAINIDSYECCCLMIFIIQGMENAWSLAYLYMLMKMRKEQESI